jgi:hypothetical protein
VSADPMSLPEGMALALIAPIALGGFLVLIGVGGSFLKAPARVRIERYLFAPVIVVGCVALLANDLARREWLWFAAQAAVSVLVVLKLLSMFRSRTPPGPPATER